MEFNLNVILNGNRGNISIEFSGSENIDKDKLKQSINDVVDCLLDNKAKNDFITTNGILLKDENINNETQPNYIKNPIPIEKYNGTGTIEGATMEQAQDTKNLVVKNDNSYLSYIVISQLRYDKKCS